MTKLIYSVLIILLFQSCSTYAPLQSPRIVDGINCGTYFGYGKQEMVYHEDSLGDLSTGPFDWNTTFSKGFKNRFEITGGVIPFLVFWSIDFGTKIRLFSLGNSTFSIFSNGRGILSFSDFGPIIARYNIGPILGYVANKELDLEIILSPSFCNSFYQINTYKQSSEDYIDLHWISLDAINKSIDITGGIISKPFFKANIIRISFGAIYRYPLDLKYSISNKFDNSLSSKNMEFINKWYIYAGVYITGIKRN